MTIKTRRVPPVVFKKSLVPAVQPPPNLSTADLPDHITPLNWRCIGKQKLWFQILHVPKSGGTSVIRNLLTQCRDGVACIACCNGHHVFQHADIVAAERRKDPSLNGCKQMVLSVRHPVPTIVSAFYESKAWLESPNSDVAQCNHFECPTPEATTAMKDDNFTLHDAIHFKPEPFYTRNKMTMYLADRIHTIYRSDEVRGMEVRKPMAYRRLGKHVDFIILNEKLQEGMQLLFAHYNISALKYFNQWDFNPHPKLAPNSPLWEEIARQNSVDMEFYSESVRLYERQKEMVLKRIWPRVPVNFTCAKAKCMAAPPRCQSMCTRKKAWMDDPDPDPG